ncbi:MAG: hypothetical protein CBD03_04970 [Rhizobiales bacterium TMED143]|nr:dipeptide epimerase [Rhodobiaceae bacterium]MBL6787368.1 dipeptide epimerase [PS1 clade bacterium]OUV91688.1 MAG: hypothetical protein CBD03_04970 [Rhizobiales bacterium TMED143]CAI8429212.1 MAG: L-Ala-D/L-Glu epimerase [Rhodobiaceae bacterium UBA7378]
MTRTISINADTFPLRQAFAIARGTKVRAEPISVEIYENGVRGHGEALPYPRYGETVETVTATIDQLRGVLADGLSRDDLQTALQPGAARCALDCALWDLEAKTTGKPVWQLAGLSAPHAITTAFTIVLDGADTMARAAHGAAGFPLLKIKLGSSEGVLADITRLREIRKARPDAQLIVDANEGWRVEDLARYAELLGAYDVRFFEQPVAAREQDGLSDIDLPFCADESVHETRDLDTLPAAYSWVNVKLDKAGGFTEALEMVRTAKSRNLQVMIGCMVASSLSMAPAHLLAQLADLADLDGPLWLSEDRDPGLMYSGSSIAPPPADLWG